MSVNITAYNQLKEELEKNKVTLVAVSKTKPNEDIQDMYDLGQRDFGENYVQELNAKHEALPKDIRWHFIGHLQSNKVKYIAPFVHLIHGVDSASLLKEVNKQAGKFNTVIGCLLQVHIAQEETKFGLDEAELRELMDAVAANDFPHVKIKGLMGMASFTENTEQIKKEFEHLHSLYKKYPGFSILSMGMSSDYRIAVEHGSNMVRIGSLLFGAREYNR